MANKMDKINKIIKLGRLQFLMAGFLLYSLGALFAALNIGEFSGIKFLWGYAILMPAHLSISYSNDYFDWKADQFNSPSNFTGGSGILVQNPELKNFARNFAIILIAISLIVAILFAWNFSLPEILILAIFGNFLGWFYSAPPLKFSYHGWGEVSTSLTGFLLPGLGYLALTGYIDLKFLLFALPLIIFQLIFICTVEIPDKEADIKGGKKNLIVSKGREFGFRLIGICSITGTLILLVLSFVPIYSASINFRYIALISFILLIPSIYGFYKRPESKKEASALSEKILISLIIFAAISDIYFSYLFFK